MGTVDFNLFQPREETRTASLSCMAAVALGYLVSDRTASLAFLKIRISPYLAAIDARCRGLHMVSDVVFHRILLLCYWHLTDVESQVFC